MNISMNISILNNYSKLYFSNDISVLDICYSFLTEYKNIAKIEAYNVILLIYNLIIKKILFDNNRILNFRNDKDNYEKILVESYINSYVYQFNDSDLRHVYQNSNFRNFLSEYLNNIYPINLNYSSNKSTINLYNSFSYRINKSISIPLANLFCYMIINFFYSAINSLKYSNNSNITMCLSLKIILQYFFLTMSIKPNISELKKYINNSFLIKLITHLNDILFNKLKFNTNDVDFDMLSNLIINLSFDFSSKEIYLYSFKELKELKLINPNWSLDPLNDILINNLKFINDNKKPIFNVFKNQFNETNRILELPINFIIFSQNENLFYSNYSTFLSNIENNYLFNNNFLYTNIKSIINNYKHSFSALQLGKEVLPQLNSINQVLIQNKDISNNLFTFIIPFFIKKQMMELESNDLNNENNDLFVKNIFTFKSNVISKETYTIGVTEFNKHNNKSVDGNMPFLFEKKNVNEDLSNYLLELVNKPVSSTLSTETTSSSGGRRKHGTIIIEEAPDQKGIWRGADAKSGSSNRNNNKSRNNRNFPKGRGVTKKTRKYKNKI